jgi:hypothetical protein
MKIDKKDLKKLDGSLILDAVGLIKQAEKIDNSRALGTGYAQSAVLAELFAKLYNDPSSGIPSSDMIKIVYKKKDQQ